MENHGSIFKEFVESKKLVKSRLAKDLGMSKQNLYQLFDSKEFKPETIQNIEKVLKVKWGNIDKVNIDSKLIDTAPTSNGHQSDPTPMNAIHSLAESTNKLSDSNLINARNIERLIALLEMRLVTAANINPELAPRGTQGTIPITKEGQQKNQHKAG